jgi:hypothetical protein
VAVAARTARSEAWRCAQARPAWHALFPEIDLATLDAERDARLVIARILEQGRMTEVTWCVKHYGRARIHRFFRDEGDPSLSPRTIALWRGVLGARGEPWAVTRRSRLRKLAPWPG